MVRWSIMVDSERVANDVPNGGGIGLGHLLRAVERGWRVEHRVGRQREHLKELAIKRDEVLLDEGITGEEVVIQGELSQRTDLLEALGGQAVSSSDQDHKPLEEQCMLTEPAPEAIADEAMLEESKAAGNLANPLGTQGPLGNHDAPPGP